jgi:hypothetical protein
MKIILPDGFPMPENARPGEAFEVVATIQPSDDGTFDIAALDGMPMPEEEMMEEETEEMGEMPDRTDSSNISIPFE